MIRKTPYQTKQATPSEIDMQLTQLHDEIVDLSNGLNALYVLFGDLDRTFPIGPNEKRTVTALLNHLYDRVARLEDNHPQQFTKQLAKQNRPVSHDETLLTDDGFEVF